VSKLTEAFVAGAKPEGMMAMLVKATGGEGVQFG
jgi:hypothetical protein